MTISILVLKQEKAAYELSKKLQEASTQIMKFELVEPDSANLNEVSASPSVRSELLSPDRDPLVKKVKIDDVRLLNPKMVRRERQRNMSLWLMPFGLIAGLTFAGMTNLGTFSKIGFSQIGNTFIGGFLGMGSGLIGSFFAAASVNTYQKDIEVLKKRHERGNWLVLIQTPLETELPWQIIQEINPLEIVNLNEL